jgi:hypothetical protein
MRKLDPLRILPRRVVDIFEGDPMSLARVRIVLIGVLLPYAARLPGVLIHGPDWFMSYVRVGLGGIAFMQSFNAISWGSLVLLSYLLRRPQALVAPSLLGLGFVAFAHSGVDLGRDAQSAVAMVFIPIYSLPIVGVTFVLSFLACERGARREPRNPFDDTLSEPRAPIATADGSYVCFTCGAPVNLGASACRRCEQPFR